MIGRPLLKKVLISLALFFPFSLLALAQEAKLKEVLALAEANVKRVKNLEFEYEQSSRTIINPEAHVMKTAFQIRWDYLGREYVIEKPDSGPPVTDVWNGEVRKELAGKDGVIEGRPGNRTLSFACPLELSVRCLGVDTIGAFHKQPAELVEVKRSEDDEVYVVRFTLDAPQNDFKGNYAILCFSKKRGYAPVKRSDIANGVPWAEADIELQEISTGIWLPVKITNRALPNPVCEGDWREGSITEISVKKDSYKVNQEMTEKDFELEFPPGTSVVDRIAGNRYIVGQKADWQGGLPEQTLKDVAAQAQTARQSVSPSNQTAPNRQPSNAGAPVAAEKSHSRIPLVLLIAGVLVACMATVYIVKRKKG